MDRMFGAMNCEIRNGIFFNRPSGSKVCDRCNKHLLNNHIPFARVQIDIYRLHCHLSPEFHGIPCDRIRKRLLLHHPVENKIHFFLVCQSSINVCFST